VAVRLMITDDTVNRSEMRRHVQAASLDRHPADHRVMQ
jgi:hypothetical protein